MPKKQAQSDMPVAVIVPAVKMYVSITQGGISNGNWILSDNSALYLPTSGRVGEGYNTIIYAHNTNNLFGPLKWVNIGDSILLKDSEGRMLEYKIYEKKDIQPYDLKGLYSKEANIVTLFTCDGWFDDVRLLVRGKLISSSESKE